MKYISRNKLSTDSFWNQTPVLKMRPSFVILWSIQLCISQVDLKVVNKTRVYCSSKKLQLAFSVSLKIGCLPGYYGNHCNTTCRYPNYGKDCQSGCLCDERTAIISLDVYGKVNAMICLFFLFEYYIVYSMYQLLMLWFRCNECYACWAHISYST